MRQDAKELRPDDIIEVMYRSGDVGQSTGQRWLRAIIIHCEVGTWPLARLTDGQLTEIRPFMFWCLVAPAPVTPDAA